MQIISVSLCLSISPMASFFSCKLFTQFFLFSLRFSFEKLKRMRNGEADAAGMLGESDNKAKIFSNHHII